MKLNEKQLKHLRKLGHERKPVVWVGGKGLSDAVLDEIEQALGHHELIKVRVQGGDREDRAELIAAMCRATGAELVQRIGHVALIYRPGADIRKIVLPA